MNNRKKSFYRYLTITILSAFLGGVGGYIALSAKQLNLNVNGFIKLFPLISCLVLSIVQIAIIIILLIDYFKAKKLVYLSTEEDEEIYILADKGLSKVSSLNSVGGIIGMIGMALVNPMMSYWTHENSSSMRVVSSILGVALIVIFILYLLVGTCIQVKTVDLIKKIYPEKRGYALEKKFEDIWFESADENEKKMIGEASYYSFRLTQKLLSWIMCIVLLLGLFIPESYIYAVLIGIIWLTQTISYSKKIREIEFKKK